MGPGDDSDAAHADTAAPATPATDPTLAAAPATDPTLAAAPATDPTQAQATPPSGGAQPGASGREPLPTVEPAHYTDRAEIARGGMGRIVRARDRRMGRPVALKEMLARDIEGAQRFEREALITGRLQHPGIVPVYEAGRWPSGAPFYAMKMVAGRSLDKVVAERQTLAERLALLPSLIQVCEAIAYAHSQKIIHRDLKPANVLIGDFGETVVIDWGLAKDLSAAEPDIATGPYRKVAEGLTLAGTVIGTPSYMPPEQARGEPVDQRGDVFALGCIAYHVLTGRPPFLGKSIEDVLENVVQGAYLSFDRVAPDVPRDLGAIVERALAHERDARYPDARALAEELRRFQTGQLVAAHQYSTMELVRRWVRRHRTPVIVAAAALLVLAVGAVVSVTRIVRARDAAQVARVDADRERARAESRSRVLIEAQGRQALLGGNPAQAAGYLAGVYAETPQPSLALRVVLGDALRAVIPDGLSAPEAESWPPSPSSRSPDGKRELRGTAVFDLASGQRLAELPGLEDDPLYTTWSLDGRRIVIAGAERGGHVQIWDGATYRLVGDIPAAPGVFVAAISDDATLILRTNIPRLTAELWDATSGAKISDLVGNSPILAGAFSPDRGLCATAAADGVRIWDVATGQTWLALPSPVAGAGLRFTPDGRWLLIPTARGVERWDVRARTPISFTRGTGGGANLIGGRVASHVDDEDAWDPASGLPLVPDRATGGEDGWDLLSADATRYLTAWGIRRAGSGELLVEFDPRVGAYASMAISRDGQRAVICQTDGCRIYDGASGAQLGICPGGGPGRGRRATFSPDASRLYMITEDSLTACASSGAVLYRVRSAEVALQCVISDPTGKQLLTCTAAGALVWDARSGVRLHALSEQSLAGVEAAAYNRDATLAVTGGIDGLARVWDPATGALLRVLAGHRRPLSRVAFADDGRVLTTSHDGTAKLWPLPIERRDAREVSALVARHVPWRLDRDGRLVATMRAAVTFEPAAPASAPPLAAPPYVELLCRAECTPRQTRCLAAASDARGIAACLASEDPHAFAAMNLLAAPPPGSRAAPMGALVHLGSQLDRATLRPGEPFTLTHTWQVVSPPGEEWLLHTLIASDDGQSSIRHYQTAMRRARPVGSWRVGEVIRDPEVLVLPASWHGEVAELHVIGGFRLTASEETAERELAFARGDRREHLPISWASQLVGRVPVTR